MIENFYINRELFFWINSLAGKNKILDVFFIFLSKYLIFILLALYLFYFARLIWKDRKIEIKEFIIYFSGAFFAWAMSKIFKFFISAERPFSFFHLETLLKHNNVFSSFPSGHSTFAFALAFSVYFYNKKIGSIFIFLAFLVALGRVLTGVHYPLDIIFGGLLGSFVSFLLFKAMKYFYAVR